MKNIIITILLLVFVGCGTDQGEGIFYKYTVINESGKPIRVEAYDSQFPDQVPIITRLAVGEKLTKTYETGLPPSSYGFENFFGEEQDERDSLRVIYNNSKIEIFKGECSEQTNNPLNFCVYNGLETAFIFTQQDYENAEPCDGGC